MKLRLSILMITGILLFSCKEKEEIEPSCCDESEHAVTIMHGFLQGLWGVESTLSSYYDATGQVIYTDSNHLDSDVLYYGDSTRVIDPFTKEAFQANRFKVFIEDCKYYIRIDHSIYNPDGLKSGNRLEIIPIGTTSFKRIESAPLDPEYRHLFKGAVRYEVAKTHKRK